MVIEGAERLRITGRIQGVGFRPFIFRLASRLGLQGWVCNRLGSVEIHVEGGAEALARFAAALIEEAPPLARPLLSERTRVECEGFDHFTILASSNDEKPEIHLPPDQFACRDCLTELNDPHDRRYRYPFLNCTQCGPRYSIIDRLPYDRANTSMTGFPLCPTCRAEYDNPHDRRFHAQPLACPECGPKLHFRDQLGHDLNGSEAALAAAIEALKAGQVVAVKGIGGYHLLCSAIDEPPIRRLRHTKNRPRKPFAVMVAERGEDGLDAARAIAEIDPVAAAMLCDPLRPIVLVRRHEGSGICDEIAPGLGEIGLMLPYSPLHTLLAGEFGKPLVATSGNISGEPVLTEAAEAEAQLYDIADAFLHHNRPIRRPVDDALFRPIAGRARPLRIGRGNAPMELELPLSLERPVLAVGAHNKTTVTLAWERRAVVSQHLGNLNSPRTIALFEQVIEELQRLYGIEAEIILCDAHPGYFSHRWARNHPLAHHTILHHHAHASALYGERGLKGELLVFTWDGIGYGDDGTLWGGEALYGSPGNWRRVATLRPFSLPGGEQTALEPWRSAQSLCWETGREWRGNPRDNVLLHHAWKSGINCPRSSSAGRLFDAAAAFTGTLKQASFDGEAPMRLEALASPGGEAIVLPLARDAGGIVVSDWEPLLEALLEGEVPAAARSTQFHASLARLILDQCRTLADHHDFTRVGLTGGVFQNRLLTEQARQLLQEAGFEVLLPRQLPCNDAGISYGQTVEWLYRQAGRDYN